MVSSQCEFHSIHPIIFQHNQRSKVYSEAWGNILTMSLYKKKQVAHFQGRHGTTQEKIIPKWDRTSSGQTVNWGAPCLSWVSHNDVIRAPKCMGIPIPPPLSISCIASLFVWLISSDYHCPQWIHLTITNALFLFTLSTALNVRLSPSNYVLISSCDSWYSHTISLFARIRDTPYSWHRLDALLSSNVFCQTN